MRLYTVGHSNVPAGRFVELLRQHDVVVVVDVRSVPYSRHNPQFNRENLQHTLESAGLRYLHMGQSLGGRPDDVSCYEGGQVRLERIATRSWYQEAVDRLIDLASTQCVVILCAEEDPRRCHRHYLVSQTLLDRGVSVWHIRGDGRLEQAGRESPQARQLPLFEGLG